MLVTVSEISVYYSLLCLPV